MSLKVMNQRFRASHTWFKHARDDMLQACREESTERVKRYLAKEPLREWVREDDSVLIEACKRGSAPIVELLMKSGALVTRLALGCAVQYPDVLALLLSARTWSSEDIDYALGTINGRRWQSTSLVSLRMLLPLAEETSERLRTACLLNGDACAKVILEHFPRLVHTRVDGKTLLEKAALHPNLRLAERLVEMGAVITDGCGTLAAASGDLETARWFFERGARADFVRYIASYRPSRAMIRFMLQYFKPSRESLRVAATTALRNCEGCLQDLLEYGAPLDSEVCPFHTWTMVSRPGLVLLVLQTFPPDRASEVAKHCLSVLENIRDVPLHNGPHYADRSELYYNRVRYAEPDYALTNLILLHMASRHFAVGSLERGARQYLFPAMVHGASPHNLQVVGFLSNRLLPAIATPYVRSGRLIRNMLEEGAAADERRAQGAPVDRNKLSALARLSWDVRRSVIDMWIGANVARFMLLKKRR